jgi:methylglutaconyl-CoA hydratase
MVQQRSSHYSQLTIQSSHQDRIAIVTIRRPQVRNALNTQLIDELTSAFTELRIDEHLHGVVLASEGDVFCAGADINMMREAANYSEEENYNDALRLSDMLYTINTFPCPVIGRVQGHALGGGVGLVSVCDIVIAAETARFAFSEVKLGIAPAVISPYAIRKIGETNARMLFVTGERFSATRAQSIGLVHSVVASDYLDEAIQKALNELLSGGPQAIRASKALALQIGHMSEEQARQHTARLNAQLRVSAEGQDGLNAFLEKRSPRWIR